MAINESKIKPKVKYGLHIGKIISDFIEPTPQAEIAKKLNISAQGFGHRLNNPLYGSVYDIIEISMLLGTDFLSPARDVIYNNGIAPAKTFTEFEMKDLLNKLEIAQNRIIKLDRENDLLHKLLEKPK